MNPKTILTILLLTLLTACVDPDFTPTSPPQNPIDTWTAAVRAQEWDAATALMAGDTAAWQTFADSARRPGRWETTTIVGGPTPVAGGQQYGLHWYRNASPEFTHRCTFIVLDDQGKIHADTQFVNCGQFEALK